ncbi:MAG: hypothetical protein EXR62_15995 [Chloroflexi bacterium]|nr:hypothetical protein [Chloroflexota bacterium]
MSKSLGDLSFILFILTSLTICVRLLYLTLRRRNLSAVSKKLVVTLCVYILVLLGASYLSQEQLVPMGADKCFDDWCATVTGSNESGAIGDTRAQGKFITVDLRVTSRARRISQAPDTPRIVVIQGSGETYPISQAGQSALERQETGLKPLASKIDAGASFDTKAVFDMPVNAQNLRVLISEGSWITMFLPDYENSFFHKKVVYAL